MAYICACYIICHSDRFGSRPLQHRAFENGTRKAIPRSRRHGPTPRLMSTHDHSYTALYTS